MYYSNFAETNGDSLSDRQEVDTEKIDWEADGTILLPTISDCLEFGDKTYAEDGLWISKHTYSEMLSKIEEMLEKDIPVVFSVGPNKKVDFPMYQLEASNQKGDLYQYAVGKKILLVNMLLSQK